MFQTIPAPYISSKALWPFRRLFSKALWILLVCGGVPNHFGAAPASAQAASRTKIPSFASPVLKPAEGEAFEAFIENHRGKLIHLNTSVGVRMSAGGEKQGGTADFFVATDWCTEGSPLSDCAGSHYLLSGADYTLRYYAGDTLLIGYFIVDEDVEMHQGRYYKLKSVPAERVLLQR